MDDDRIPTERDWTVGCREWLEDLRLSLGMAMLGSILCRFALGQPDWKIHPDLVAAALFYLLGVLMARSDRRKRRLIGKV